MTHGAPDPMTPTPALVARLRAAMVTYPGKEHELMFVTISAEDARAILAALASPPQATQEETDRLRQALTRIIEGPDVPCHDYQWLHWVDDIARAALQPPSDPTGVSGVVK